MLKESPKAFGIEKESFYLVSDPHTEGSATTAGVSAITAVDAQSADSFLSEVLLVVPFEKSMSIKCADVFAMGARRAFE